MIASLLVCHYIKHGMTCELGTEGIVTLILLLVYIAYWGVLLIAVRAGSGRDIDRKGAG